MVDISSGIWTSDISNLKLHPFPNGFYPKDPLMFVLLIWRSRITSNIYLEYMDLCHISLRSDGYESLWDFTQSPWIHTMSSLYFSIYIHLRSSGLRDSMILVLKLKPHYNFPRARDLLTSVHLQINNSRFFRLWVFQCFTFSFLYISWPTDTYSSGSNGPD
jgi:hypothetical protein